MECEDDNDEFDMNLLVTALNQIQLTASNLQEQLNTIIHSIENPQDILNPPEELHELFMALELEAPTVQEFISALNTFLVKEQCVNASLHILPNALLGIQAPILSEEQGTHSGESEDSPRYELSVTSEPEGI